MKRRCHSCVFQPNLTRLKAFPLEKRAPWLLGVCGRFSSANQLRHMRGLRVFLNSARLKMLATFAERKRSVACAVSALKFAAALLGWKEFHCKLGEGGHVRWQLCQVLGCSY